MDQRDHDDGSEAQGRTMNINKVAEEDGAGGNRAKNRHQQLVVAREDLDFVPATSTKYPEMDIMSFLGVQHK